MITFKLKSAKTENELIALKMELFQKMESIKLKIHLLSAAMNPERSLYHDIEHYREQLKYNDEIINLTNEFKLLHHEYLLFYNHCVCLNMKHVCNRK
jgi:hypothetical protein